ncbi:retinoblastoma family protein-like [Anopheles bellator]|uniref:retinoblastoma family protein-like n=1 Tax=Anopheles bellator TaxID=139047 RepID=UPI0026496FEF|nr:retinoblastoma family protein-like [Anopheles bellator]
MTTLEEGSFPLAALAEQHRKICRALNIDVSTEGRSWDSFVKTRAMYDLTGSQAHWMCCSLYVACLQEIRPAVGNPAHFIRGNGVHITNLLKECGISIQEFFDKINEWSLITSLPPRLKATIENLQHEFRVTMKAYTTGLLDSFARIFNASAITPDEPKRNKKAKPNPCSYNRLREFTWVLFLCVKEQYQEERRDHSTAINLCVCVLDLIFQNVVAEGRLELLNAAMLPPLGGDGSGDTAVDPDGGAAAMLEACKKVAITPLLCSEYQTTVECVAETYRTIFLPVLLSMFETKDLRGTHITQADLAEKGPIGAEQFLNLLTVANFDENMKSLNRRYERYILRCGMLDERIVLSVTSSPSLQQRWSVSHPRTPLSMKAQSSRTMALVDGTARQVRGGVVSDVSLGIGSGAACNELVLSGNLKQLKRKIHCDDPGEPRKKFLQLMSNCVLGSNPQQIVMNRLAEVRDRFVRKLTEEKWYPRGSHARFDAIEALYYLLLGNIITWEIRKRPTIPTSKVIYDMSANDLFNETVIVCAAEIVFHLRQEQTNFPWILTVLHMQPLDFYRIIEVTVLANSDLLTADIVNHLQRVEEQTLDSLCWANRSILWEKVEKESYQIPQYKDVEQSSQIAGITPLKGDSVPNTANGASRDGRMIGGGGAAVSASATETGCSSNFTPSNTGRQVPPPDSAKKKLSFDAPSTPTKQTAATPLSTAGSTAERTMVSPSPSPSKADAPPSAPRGHSANGSSPRHSTEDHSSNTSPSHENGAPTSTDKRVLKAFFRKFYAVAYARLKDLCQRLGLESPNIQMLIWTIFEHTITKCSKELMRDRHLDQLLMCAIFVTTRIKKLPNTFKDIMTCYLGQPQATSSIYRNVFIRYKQPSEQMEVEAREGREERIPTCSVAGASRDYDREEYGDIIKFYNDIYVKIVHPFVIKYIDAYVNTDMESLFLSPMPKTQPRNIQKSPRQISANINLYVSTTDKSGGVMDSPTFHTYTFQQSPAKDLHIINSKVRGSDETCVRSLTELTSFSDHSVADVRRLNKIRQDRQQQDKD